MLTTIFLRELERSDLPVINRWRADRAAVDQLGSAFRHVAFEVDEQWYERYLAARNNNVRLAICLSDARMVGVVYLLDIDWVHRNAEFAIWIGEPTAQGQGIGKAASRLALEHAFRDMNLERVHLTVLAHNERAIQLYRGMGFVQEGTLRRAAFKGGRFCDVIMMAMLREEYVATRSRDGQ